MGKRFQNWISPLLRFLDDIYSVALPPFRGNLIDGTAQTFDVVSWYSPVVLCDRKKWSHLGEKWSMTAWKPWNRCRYSFWGLVGLLFIGSKVCRERSYMLCIRICLFYVSNFYCMMKKHLKVVLTCGLYYVMVVAGDICLWNTKYECVGRYEMLRVSMGSRGKFKYGAA